MDGHSVWPYVVFQVLVAGLVALLWLSDIVSAILASRVPSVLAGTGLPVPVIQSLDLGVLLPRMHISAYWLWNEREWGYAVSGVLLAKTFTLGLAVLAMAILQIRDGQVVPLPMIVIFGLISLFGLVLAGRFVLAIDERRI